MPFYPPPYRRDPFQMPRQRFGPPAPNQFRGPNNFYPPSNQFRGPNNFYPPQNQFESRPYFNPNEQPPYGRTPTDLNAMMGHVGTITNGINMMRQLGGALGFFR